MSGLTDAASVSRPRTISSHPSVGDLKGALQEDRTTPNAHTLSTQLGKARLCGTRRSHRTTVGCSELPTSASARYPNPPLWRVRIKTAGERQLAQRSSEKHNLSGLTDRRKDIMSRSVLRLYSSPAAPPDFTATTAKTNRSGNQVILFATMAASADTTEFVRRFIASYPRLDTMDKRVVVILVIIIAWLRLRYGLAVPVTVVLATVWGVPHAARRAAGARITCPGWA